MGFTEGAESDAEHQPGEIVEAEGGPGSEKKQILCLSVGQGT